ncbi:MAG: HAD family phosphatase [Oscillospiraceae bacterium]|nr:HAD family phosphatase [Oscillospiraceae bacterium]
MKKGAIFDMDGTLFDTERLYAKSWTITAEQFGFVPNQDFPLAVAGTSGEGQREVIRQYYPEADALAFQNECIAGLEKMLQNGLPEKPGVRELLTFFRENGVKMAVASSNSRGRIEKNLRRAGIEDFFDAVVSGEEVSRGKPFPDIFLLSAQRLGCAPEDCYVFEDSLNGTRAGIAAGCATFMIPDMVPPTKDLRDGCTGIYATLWEIQNILSGNC